MAFNRINLVEAPIDSEIENGKLIINKYLV